MGLFDAAKRFTGGKNLADVQITRIERADPAEAFFPLNDSVRPITDSARPPIGKRAQRCSIRAIPEFVPRSPH